MWPVWDVVANGPRDCAGCSSWNSEDRDDAELPGERGGKLRAGRDWCALSEYGLLTSEYALGGRLSWLELPVASIVSFYWLETGKSSTGC